MKLKGVTVLLLIYFVSCYSQDQPSLVWPNNNYSQVSDSVFFEWNLPVDLNIEHTQFQVSTDSLFQNIFYDINSNSDNILLHGFENFQTFYWKTRFFDGTNFLSWSEIRMFQRCDISSLQNVKLWLSVDSGLQISNDSVSSWADRSGNGFNATQTNNTYKPLLDSESLNNLRLVHLRNGSFLTIDTSLKNIQNLAILTVFSKKNASITGLLYGASPSDGSSPNSYGVLGFNFWGGAGSIDYSFGDGIHYSAGQTNDNIIENNRFYVFTDIRENTIPFNGFFINNIPVSVSSSSTGANSLVLNENPFCIGRSGLYNGAYFNGYIAEFIAIENFLNTDSIKYISNYLSSKYFPEVNLGKDVQVCDSVYILTIPNIYDSVLWSNGATNTNQITINTNGVYWVRVVDKMGNISYDSVLISKIYPTPNISLNINDSILCQGNTIICTLSDPVVGYLYNWSNGEIASNISISQAGMYFVAITDTSGCTFTSDTAHIGIDFYPSTTSLGADLSLCAGQSIGLETGADQTEQYIWNTGATSSEIVISASGTYQVTCTNTAGCVAIDSIDIVVQGLSPIPDFSFMAQCQGDSTRFTDLSSTLDGSQITEWLWYFGDGQSSNLQHPVHLYADTGQYTVSLWIKNNQNCENETVRTLSISPTPQASFYTDSIQSPATVHFFDASQVTSGYIESILWTLPGNVQSTESNIIFDFGTPGEYPVKLKITNNFACADSIVQTVPVGNLNRTELVMPLNHCVFIPSPIRFEWNQTRAVEQNYILELTSLSENPQTHLQLFPQQNDTVLNLSEGQYRWRVKSWIDSDWSDYAEFIVINIQNRDSLYMWLNADYISANHGDSISLWPDSSGFFRDLIQLSPTKSPRFYQSNIELNGHSKVFFDGVNDYLQITEGILYQPTNYILVLKPLSLTGDIFSGGVGIGHLIRTNGTVNLYSDSYISGTSIIDTTKFAIYNFEFNSPNTKSFINNYIDSYGENGYSTSTGFTIGSLSNGDNNFKSEIVEIIIINDSLTDSLRTLIHRYLYCKYAPSVNLGKDIWSLNSFCPTTIDAGARFTNFLWNTGDITQTIQVTKSGEYSVIVTDIFGYESSDTIMVYYPEPYQLPDTLICYGDTINWNINLQNPNYTFLWNNNSTDSLLKIYNAGDYYVKITDTLGCTFNSDTSHISIDNYPITTTLGNDTSLCAGQNLYLQQGATETASYLWNTGSVASYITVNGPSQYSVTCTNLIGCMAKDTIDIQIHGFAPVVGFDYTNTCFNDNTIFSDTSFTTDNSNIISRNWNFGNGETSNIQNPNLQYSDTGTFTVSLTITTDSACSNTIIKDVIINPLPIANFANTQLCERTDIYFTNTSSIPTGSIINSLWKYGNGDSSMSISPIYNYDTAGYYNLQLIVMSNKNCKDTISENIEIKPIPKTDFNFSATCKGKIVNFYNNTETLVYNPIYEHKWDFGDGNTSNNENVNYVFDINDTINDVTLYIKTINGCSQSITKQIVMHNIPYASIVNETACEKNYYTLQDSINKQNDTIISYLWQVNNNFYYAKNPEIYFNNSGTANLSLTVTSNNNCTNNITKILTIYELPNSDFEINPPYGIINELTTLTPNEQNENKWTFGNGEFSLDTIVSTSFSDSGTYAITHYSTNHYNCVDSTKKDYLVVFPKQDIAITSINTSITNNKLYTSIGILNLGNLPVKKIELILTPENKTPITEIWEGELLFGSVLNYNFSSIYNLNSNETPNYVCVTANLIDKYTDANLKNNINCTNEESDFQIFPIYPNPANNEINIKLYIPETDILSLELINNIGKTISKLYNQKTNKGMNVIKISLPQISLGSYSIKATYKDQDKTMRFIKE